MLNTQPRPVVKMSPGKLALKSKWGLTLALVDCSKWNGALQESIARCYRTLAMINLVILFSSEDPRCIWEEFGSVS